MRNYQNLDAWRASMQLVTSVYTFTNNFPKEELYGLTAPIKRAAVSIPANIAEGMGRQYKKDTIQFLHVARGSIYELETLLIISKTNAILSEATFNEVILLIDDAAKLLNGLIRYMTKAELK